MTAKTKNRQRENLDSRIIPKQTRALQRRVQIIQVAESLLEKNDFSDVTTRMIAEKADIPIGSVYRYFPNKFSIMAAIASDTIEKVDEELTNLMESSEGLGNWEEIIDETINIATSAYLKRTGYINILKAMIHTPELHNLTSAYKEKMVKSLTGNFLKLGLFESEEKADSVAHVVVAIYNAMEAKVFLCDDEKLMKALIVEWKIAVKSYLYTYIKAAESKA